MRIDFNTNNQVNQNFRAVNQKYLKDAQRMFEKRQLLLNQNRLLCEARDRILPKLMSGEIKL